VKAGRGEPMSRRKRKALAPLKAKKSLGS